MLLAGFVLLQRARAGQGRVPLVDPGWFRDRAFRIGTATQLAFWCGQASYFLVLALWLQAGQGLSALESGLVFTVVAAPYLLASVQSATLLGRHGRRVVVAGALTMAAGHGVAALAVAAGGGVAAIGLVFFGVRGTDRAFALSSLVLAVVLGVVALIAGRLPRARAAR